MLNKNLFIEYPEVFEKSYKLEDPSPIFRYAFTLKPGFSKAVVTVCGLGIGYYYLNNELITEDMFTAPVSDYNKTLWTNEYDVTERLCEGENLFAIIVGNGFYNESFDTTWKTNEASWRGLPKFALQMRVDYPDDVVYIESNEQWICSKESPVRYNHLRSGETFDFRVNKNWYTRDFDAENRVHARLSAANAPKGEFRRCECQPIRMDRRYRPVNIFKNSIGRWILDFGVTISGFLQVKTQQPAGSRIKIRYCELIREDGTCNYADMDGAPFYPNSEFQTDTLIFSGNVDEWHPLFAYHGFRYAEIEGLDDAPKAEDFTAVFVHQMVEDISEFECSDEVVNKLFSAARTSCLSNMFYNLTDCPTREKFGWLNDASASCEQLLQNFDSYPLLEKWLQDIFDSVSEQGAVPSVVPTGGFGYDSWTGPICTDALFEIPYKMYRYYGKREVLTKAYPYMRKHLAYVVSKRETKDGLIGYGLSDWAGPFTSENPVPTPVKFTDTLLAIKFCRITAFAAQLVGDDAALAEIKSIERELTDAFCNAYVDGDGRCTVCEQTALSIMIVLGLYRDLEPLKQQLYSAIEKYDFHLHCGMLGTQYLFKALNICRMPEYAYRLITADGHPSYKDWIDNGATTLLETWNGASSHNHHMYSCVLSWFNTTLAGITLDEEVNAYKKAVISPRFLEEITYCKATYKTASGVYRVNWSKERQDKVVIRIEIPRGAEATLTLSGYRSNGLKNIPLVEGINEFVCHKE